MCVRGVWALVMVVVPTIAHGLGGDPAWRIWNDPLSLSVHRDDHTVVLRSSFSPEPCLYDAAGQATPGGLDCRYDHLYRPLARDRFLREEAGELVLLDERGAGALVRAWMTTGDGFSADFPSDLRLRVRLDGNPIPYIDLPVADWFSGSVWPFHPPLVGDRHTAAGAGYAYVPIAFRSGAQVSLAGPAASIDQGRIWYQFTVHRSTAGGGAAASGVPADLDRWQRFVATPAGQYPWPAELNWHTSEVVVPAGDGLDLADVAGAGVLLALRLRPGSPEAWSSLRLTATVDGDVRIDLPMALLFGLPPESPGPVRGLLLGQDAEGFGYLYLAQPFHARMRLRLTNTGSTAMAVASALAWSAEAAPAGALRLLARSTGECLETGRYGPDLSLLRLDGRGRWLALVVEQGNLHENDANHLEGDERLYLDGSPHPAWHGTGVEDYFNGGFYFDRGGYGFRHALPLAGAPWHRMSASLPVRSRMYRLNLVDAVPFQTRLDLRAERGAYGDQPMCANAVAWAYHEPEVALAQVASLDLADPESVAAADYQASADAQCWSLTSAYADEPATVRSGRVCAFSSGSSRFRLSLRQRGEGFWLRRRFDGQGGGQAAAIVVDDRVVARLPYAMAHPHRRWQEIDVPLDLPPQAAGTVLTFRVVPDDPAAAFTDSHYLLLARAGDALFVDGFEPPP